MSEELKEGVWPHPVRAMLRRKISGEWTDKHRSVMRKLVVEGGRVQRRLYDTGLSGEKKCRGCNNEEGREKHRLYHCPCWKEIGSQIPEKLRKMGAKNKDIKERLDVTWASSGRSGTPCFFEGQVAVDMRVVCPKYVKKMPLKQARMVYWKKYQADGVRVDGQWCRWITMRRMGPMHGMYGTLDAELEVQRTIKRAELTAFLCLLRKAISLIVVHVDNKGIIDGLWRGEMRCSGPRAKDADFVDLDLGRVTQSSPRRHTGGGQA